MTLVRTTSLPDTVHNRVLIGYDPTATVLSVSSIVSDMLALEVSAVLKQGSQK